MEGSGKWTEIFIKKNGSEHLLSPHSLFFLRSICGISFHGAGSSLKYFKRLGPAGPFLQPSSERGRPWMMIVCVWRFNWKTFPEVERRAEEMISPSLIFFPPNFQFGISAVELETAAPLSGESQNCRRKGAACRWWFLRWANKQWSLRPRFKPAAKNVKYSLIREAQGSFFLLCLSLHPLFTVYNPVRPHPGFRFVPDAQEEAEGIKYEFGTSVQQKKNSIDCITLHSNKSLTKWRLFRKIY